VPEAAGAALGAAHLDAHRMRPEAFHRRILNPRIHRAAVQAQVGAAEEAGLVEVS
jgi:predicted NodU family carbamoyl transferase